MFIIQFYFVQVKKMVEMIRLAYSSSFDQKLWMDKRTMLNAIIKVIVIDYDKTANVNHSMFHKWD